MIYDALTEEDITKITRLMLRDVESRLREKNISVEWSENLVHRISVI